MKEDEIIFNEITVTKAAEHSICATDRVYSIWAIQKQGQGCQSTAGCVDKSSQHCGIYHCLQSRGQNKPASWAEAIEKSYLAPVKQSPACCSTAGF